MLVNLIIAIIAIGLSGLVGYWASDREDPTTLRSVEPITDRVAPGGILKLKHNVVRKRSCRVHLEQILFDGENARFTTQDEDYNASPGRIGDEHFVIQVSVPNTATEGDARYRGIRSYYCNPLHYWFNWPIVVDTPDVKFEIRRD